MPSRLKLRPRSTPPTPPTDAETLFLDEADGALKSIDSDGVVTAIGAGGGAAALSLDNTIDPPSDITSLVAAGASIVGSEATLRGKDFYAQDTDPGAVGAGSVWKNTSVFPYEWWERNTGDDGWDSYAVVTAVAVGNNNATADVSAIALGTGAFAAATMAAVADTGGTATGGAVANRAGVEAGMRCEVDGTSARTGFFGTTPVARPVIPATPDAQDIADVLVALGLATQTP